MRSTEVVSEETKHKSLIVGLVSGIVLGLGPLWGAIVAVLTMSYDYIRLKEALAAGQRVTEGVGMPIVPIAIGFLVCPIGIAMVVRNVLKLSDKIQAARKPKH